MRTSCKFIALMLVALVHAGSVLAQDYPTKPIRFIVPGVGGGGDFVARLVGNGLSGRVGQAVVIENRPVGIIPGDAVAKAAPDGYTLLVSGSSLWLAAFMQDDVPFDVLRDFSPVTLLVTSPNVLVVTPKLEARSVKELIALAKAKPGVLNYASNSTGSSPHLAAELFKSMAGADIVRINYKNNVQSIADLMSGQVQMMFSTAGAAAPLVKAGKLRALAVTSAKPTELVPDLPTVAATLPGYETESVFGLLAPAKTPAPIIARINREVVLVLKTPDVKEKFITSGVEPVGTTPEEFLARIKGDMNRLGKVIKDANIRAE
jgi:tripartite-type tricarboxylate transporter receptor subunit TctC